MRYGMVDSPSGRHVRLPNVRATFVPTRRTGRFAGPPYNSARISARKSAEANTASLALTNGAGLATGWFLKLTPVFFCPLLSVTTWAPVPGGLLSTARHLLASCWPAAVVAVAQGGVGVVVGGHVGFGCLTR